MRHAMYVLLACLGLAMPTVSGAQRSDGPRGALSFSLSDGEPVSFYLEIARELELSDEQRSRLIETRRKLRVQNAPFMRQLDSLRQLAGVDMSERGQLSASDREALERFKKISAPVMDAIRLNNTGARQEIRLILDERQMVKADSMAKAVRETRTRRPEDRGLAPSAHRHLWHAAARAGLRA